ncbi:MAG: hypothetical protein Q8Q05_04060 [bacterium]|nr:hypothetical protein [bacterium]
MNSKIWALVRIALGLIFLWAFFDKVFGLGFATKASMSWLSGGSPTAGYLAHATTGPLAPFYQNLSGSGFVDWMFMIGLLGIGVAMVFGVGMHIAGWGGALMMVAMWSAAWPIENNPFIDEHIIYALLLMGFGSSDVGSQYSFRTWWRNTRLVTNHPFLG